MIPTAYLESIRERLVTDPLVVNFRIRRERQTASNGYLRALLLLSNSTQLEFSEYFQLTPEGDLVVITYSYNWSDMDGVLIQRWDNTPHYPDLPGYPHHVHEGKTEEVIPGRSMSIFAILDVLTRAM